MVKNKIKHLPNFFIVGAAKAGTTALQQYLGQHPDVYFSPIKETHFFSTDIDPAKFRQDFRKAAEFDVAAYLDSDMGHPVHQAFVQDENQYLKLFKGADSKTAVGEAAVSYLWSKKAAANIRTAIPGARIILILRNPVDRAFSHYLMDLLMGGITDPFVEAVKKDLSQAVQGWGITNLYVELGLYCEQVSRYLDQFPREQVRVIFYEDYKTAPKDTLRALFRFLGLDEEAVNLDVSMSYNQSQLPRFRVLTSLSKQKKLRAGLLKLLPSALQKKLKTHLYTTKGLPRLTLSDREWMLPHFQEDIKKLSVLLEHDLSHWLHIEPITDEQ